MDAQLPGSSKEPTDIFSLSDQVLSDNLQFIEEIGFGNWGSVWLCRPKPTRDGLTSVPDQKIAVKLVHRSKTSTTAARVRSLWNEMKIIRTFKSDPHPSIIPFHSFIITPSYALITMAYLPTLIPVEVDETKARDWFRFLLSAIDFLHCRGVVHNDIKPANILLSTKNVPVLVDFGFAEKYDVKSSTAFLSNLSYGTPEYLSPERARGLHHDTRKADVWSLGITFFEILIGRTPFEHSDGEQFTSKEDLERYWSRTLRGKWVGSWKMSKGMEQMIRRMATPNADLRYTAPQAMTDSFWDYRRSSVTAHRRSSSYTSSIVFEKDVSKLMNTTPSWKEKENLLSRPGLSPVAGKPPKERHPISLLTKAKPSPKVAATKSQHRKHGPASPIADLSPIKGSLTDSPLASAARKENVSPSLNVITNSVAPTRKPFGAVNGRENILQTQPQLHVQLPRPSADGVKDKDRRRSRVLADITVNQNIEKVKESGKGKVKDRQGGKDQVRERVRDWEREKERLREMARLEEIERERDEMIEEAEKGKEMVEWREQMETPQKKTEKEEERGSDKENLRAVVSPPAMSPTTSTFMTESEADAEASESPIRSTNESSLSVFRHNVRRSIDKTVRLYKTSAIAQLTGRTTPAQALSVDAGEDDAQSRRSHSERESWEDEDLLRDANSSLPVVRHAVHSERVAGDSRMDRMTIWMRNVEKVVEDAQQNFASSSTHKLAPLPPLPLAPVSRSASRNLDTNRSSHLPRRILDASQIFTDDTADYTANSTGAFATVNTTTTDDAVPSEGPSQSLPDIQIHTPSRQRRATVSGLSPETPLNLDLETGSPSKRREKSKSHGNLFQQHIAPISFLEAELDKQNKPPASPRLSQVIDSSLFIAPPTRSPDPDMQDVSIIRPDKPLNDLTSSPFHVEPYPVRKLTFQIPDTPYQRRVEGVYDRFLMATSGVKRLGKGYQSDNIGPAGNTVGHATAGAGEHNGKRDSHRVFYSAKRPMPPPVSSEDVQKGAMSVDELGITTAAPVDERLASSTSAMKDEVNAGSLMQRIKAMVPGKPASRRLSRLPA